MFYNGINKDSMKQKDKIENILLNWIEYNEDVEIISDRILALFDVVGQGEQLICPKCEAPYISYTEHEYYECNSCDHTWTN